METKAREWIIYEGHTREAREFISGSDIGYAENIKVIEYSAYEKLQKRVEELEAALQGARSHAEVMEHKATRVNAMLRDREVESKKLREALHRIRHHVVGFKSNSEIISEIDEALGEVGMAESGNITTEDPICKKWCSRRWVYLKTDSSSEELSPLDAFVKETVANNGGTEPNWIKRCLELKHRADFLDEEDVSLRKELANLKEDNAMRLNENKKMREALEFYASKGRHELGTAPQFIEVEDGKLTNNFGATARQALGEVEK